MTETTWLDNDVNVPKRKKHVFEREADEDATGYLPASFLDSASDAGCSHCSSNIVGGTLKDAIKIFHGPVGCAYNTWHTKRYPSCTDNSQVKYVWSTDMKEFNVVFGGEKRLKQTMLEAFKEFPESKRMMVCTSCATALIGDDIKAVAKEVRQELNNEVDVSFSERPGFCGGPPFKRNNVMSTARVNQEIGQVEPKLWSEYTVNIIGGGFNVEGDSSVLQQYLSELGVQVIGRFTGNAGYDDCQSMHRAKLSLTSSAHSAGDIADELQKRYGIPHMDVDIWGFAHSKESLRKIGAFFNIENKVEPLIMRETAKYQAQLDWYTERLKGKKAAICVGDAPLWHWTKVLEADLAMEVVTVTYKFSFQKEKVALDGRERTVYVDEGDEKDFLEVIIKVKPDLIVAGPQLRDLMKVGNLVKKVHVPYINGHRYHNGPYMGFEGSVNMARDIYNGVYSRMFQLAKVDISEGL